MPPPLATARAPSSWLARYRHSQSRRLNWHREARGRGGIVRVHQDRFGALTGSGGFRACAADFHDDSSSRRKNLVRLGTIQIKHHAGDRRIGGEQADAQALHLFAIDCLVAQLGAGDRIDEIHDEAVGAGEHVGMRDDAIAGFDLDLDLAPSAQHLHAANRGDGLSRDWRGKPYGCA